MDDAFQDCDDMLNKMLDKQDMWSALHNSKGVISKYECLWHTQGGKIFRELTSFTGKPDTILPAYSWHTSLGFRVTKISAGMHMCTNLHRNQRPSASHKAINRLTHPSFGLLMHYIRQLYTVMVLPKIEYALLVWYTPHCKSPNSNRQTSSIGNTRVIGKVQRLSSFPITGEFRSTAIDISELHAMIPLICLHLDNTCHRNAL